MNTKKLTKLLALYLPYILLGLVATNFGEAWRLAEGKELGERIMSMMGTLPAAFANPLPSLHPLDLLIGISCGAGLQLDVDEKHHEPEQDEEEKEDAPRRSVLAVLEEKAEKAEPVKPFKSYLDKDGDAR